MLLLLLFAPRCAAAGLWTLVPDVCPDFTRHKGKWTEYKGEFGELSACESAAAKASAAAFTWNHAQKPKQCWGYSGPKPAWKPNPHCDSGCKATVSGCSKPAPPPPKPAPAPLPPGFPHWVGRAPSVKINTSAGLAPVPQATHTTVYSAVTGDGKTKNPFGVYSHGPMITHHQGVYYMSWYNAPVGEELNKRSVYSFSTDLKNWSAPAVLFPTFTQSDHGVNENGEENGPWTILNGRLYSQSGSQDAGEHHEGITSVMRQVAVGGDSSALGKPFWLNRTVPWYCTSPPVAATNKSRLQQQQQQQQQQQKKKQSPDCLYPTYLEMDATTKSDAEQLLASFIRTSVRTPDYKEGHSLLGVQNAHNAARPRRPPPLSSSGLIFSSLLRPGGF